MSYYEEILKKKGITLPPEVAKVRRLLRVYEPPRRLKVSKKRAPSAAK